MQAEPSTLTMFWSTTFGVFQGGSPDRSPPEALGGVLVMRLADPALRTAVRCLVVTLTLCLGTAGLAVVTATSAGARTTQEAVAMRSSTYEAKVQERINRVRAAHGLRPLRLQGCADESAERWARRLARNGRLYHQDPGDILRRCQARYAGETLGMGSFGPSALVRAWLDSPDHRPILLSKKARLIGVGTHLSGDSWVTAANFTRS
jgi:uncharacterized protein YkwD